MSDQPNPLSQAARAVGAEPADVFKIVIVEHVAAAGTLAQLLIRSQKVPKNAITQLGYTASDEQNAAQLRRANAIVIVAKPILVNRPCEFYPPAGAREAAIIDATGGQVQVARRPCGAEPFTLSM